MVFILYLGSYEIMPRGEMIICDYAKHQTNLHLSQMVVVVWPIERLWQQPITHLSIEMIKISEQYYK